jgi:hypothetical protein
MLRMTYRDNYGKTLSPGRLSEKQKHPGFEAGDVKGLNRSTFGSILDGCDEFRGCLAKLANVPTGARRRNCTFRHTIAAPYSKLRQSTVGIYLTLRRKQANGVFYRAQTMHLTWAGGKATRKKVWRSGLSLSLTSTTATDSLRTVKNVPGGLRSDYAPGPGGKATIKNGAVGFGAPLQGFKDTQLRRPAQQRQGTSVGDTRVVLPEKRSSPSHLFVFVILRLPLGLVNAGQNRSTTDCARGRTGFPRGAR